MPQVGRSSLVSLVGVLDVVFVLGVVVLASLEDVESFPLKARRS